MVQTSSQVWFFPQRGHGGVSRTECGAQGILECFMFTENRALHPAPTSPFSMSTVWAPGMRQLHRRLSLRLMPLQFVALVAMFLEPSMTCSCAA